MALSLNRAQIIGNLTRDPELRNTPGGAAVVGFSVATNFSWTDSSGQKQDRVEFHNVVAWRKLAEIVAQYMKKGSKVYVEGRIQTRDWTGEDGIKRYKTEIVADNVIMLDRRGAGGDSGGISAVGEDREPAGVSEPAAKGEEVPTISEEEITIDDLPF